MTTSAEKFAEADKLDAQVKELRKQAVEQAKAEGRARPLAERLRYAATSRCLCGAGLAYDPFAPDKPDSPFYGPTEWECSAILLGTADKSAKHTEPLPFAVYELKSEDQPSAHGATTRPMA